jgi:hypothetical protein
MQLVFVHAANGLAILSHGVNNKETLLMSIRSTD